MRVNPRDTSTCTIRIRSKNTIETIKGSVKRTISEHRSTKQRNHKLKEARKRLETLAKLEEYRQEKMDDEVKYLERQQQMYEELQRQEIIRAKKKQKYFDMRKKQLADASQDKMKKTMQQERKRKKEEASKIKSELKKRQYYDDQKTKLK